MQLTIHIIQLSLLISLELVLKVLIELSHEALSVNLVSYETDTVLFAVQNNGPQPLEYSMQILPQEVPTETVLFVKPDYADPYDQQNQDRITIRPGLQEVIIKVYLMHGVKIVMDAVQKIHLGNGDRLNLMITAKFNGIIGMSVGSKPLKVQAIM